MKEHNETPEKEINKMETINLPDSEFKTLVQSSKHWLYGCAMNLWEESMNLA